MCVSLKNKLSNFKLFQQKNKTKTTQRWRGETSDGGEIERTQQSNRERRIGEKQKRIRTGKEEGTKRC